MANKEGTEVIEWILPIWVEIERTPENADSLLTYDELDAEK